jgi:hypothetical protein
MAVIVPPFCAEAFWGCFVLGGGFLFDIDGDGDDREELTPFV